MCKKQVLLLYRKCFAFTLVKHRQSPSLASLIDFSTSSSATPPPRVTEVLWKDTLAESRAYLQLLAKVAELYEQVLDKAQFFRKFVAQIFIKMPLFRFLNLDALFKGFFFVFVFKDFVVREVIQRVQDQLHQTNQKHLLARVEQDYQVFMEADLTCWVSLLLECEVFESYQSIVAPNESLQTNRLAKPPKRPPQTLLHLAQAGRGVQSALQGETANFIALQKRYIKGFLAAYYRHED